MCLYWLWGRWAGPCLQPEYLAGFEVSHLQKHIKGFPLFFFFFLYFFFTSDIGGMGGYEVLNLYVTTKQRCEEEMSDIGLRENGE